MLCRNGKGSLVFCFDERSYSIFCENVKTSYWNLSTDLHLQICQELSVMQSSSEKLLYAINGKKKIIYIYVNGDIVPLSVYEIYP